jgi:hypothetical protein
MNEVVTFLASLRQPDGADLETSLEHLVALIRGEGWPAAQTEVILEDLVHELIEAAQTDRAVRRRLEQIVRALIHKFGEEEESDAVDRAPGGKTFRQAQEQLIDVLLRCLEEERSPVDRSRRGRCFRIALLLAADYNAIVSLRQRQELIRLLRELSTSFPEVYADPFIADLLFIHKAMGLGELEQNGLT